MYFTEKQLRIMQFIQQFRAERGISPTLEEIADNFGVTKITIYEHINQLERKGALKREKFRARSIELLVPVEQKEDRFSVSVVGHLRGDSPMEESDEHVSLTDFLPLGKRCFALRIAGDAMNTEHLTDGDVVIVEKRDDPENGETVVAVLDSGAATLGRYCASDKGASLKFRGGEDKLGKNTRIEGVVIGVLRKLA